MASAPMGNVLRQFSRLFASGTTVGMTEGELLDRFLKTRDEAAFAALVERFGPMVLGVCRKFLADSHAAEDAFQATFLVLVRRAATIRDRDLVGHWLYAVSLKVVKRSRADLARRRSREQGGENVDLYPEAEGLPSSPFDVGPILQEELAKLAENYRKPLVLCFLDGRSHEEAARQLGWPVGTVKGRIARGKEMLRDRLTRRGVTITTAAIAAMLSETASAMVPPLLIDSTVKAAMSTAAGGVLAAGACSATAMALSEGVVASMALSKMKMFAGALVALATVATGAAVTARQLGPAEKPNSGAQEVQKPAEPAPPAVEKKAKEAADGMDGTKIQASMARLAQLRVDLARKKLAKAQTLSEQGAESTKGVYKAARELMVAFRESGIPASSYVKDAEYLLALARQVEAGERKKESQGAAPQGAADEAQILALEAEIWLDQAKRGGQVPGLPVAQMGGMHNPARTTLGAEEPESDDPDRDKQIQKLLNKPLSMPFASETPLEEIIKYIKTSTINAEMPQGIPIYIDPVGLQEADKTLASTVVLNLDGVKLKTTLRLMLKQLDLGYYVKDGLMTITAINSEDFPLWALTPAEREVRMLERGR